jgi:AcrR family transcriptional regulator
LVTRGADAILVNIDDDVKREITAARRRGRRTAGQETKAALLAAAREVFAERGFEAATVRMIAARGGVDPAMVNHSFGGKESLFLAAIKSAAMSDAAATAQLACGRHASVGERLACAFVTTCEGGGSGGFAALARSIASQGSAARMLGEFVGDIVHPEVAPLALDRLELRAALCCAHMIGLGMARYVLGTEPLASADPETVTAVVAPSLQCYLSDSST